MILEATMSILVQLTMDLDKLSIATADIYKIIFSNRYKSNNLKSSKTVHTKSKKRYKFNLCLKNQRKMSQAYNIKDYL